MDLRTRLIESTSRRAAQNVLDAKIRIKPRRPACEGCLDDGTRPYIMWVGYRNAFVSDVSVFAISSVVHRRESTE